MRGLFIVVVIFLYFAYFLVPCKSSEDTLIGIWNEIKSQAIDEINKKLQERLDEVRGNSARKTRAIGNYFDSGQVPHADDLGQVANISSPRTSFHFDVECDVIAGAVLHYEQDFHQLIFPSWTQQDDLLVSANLRETPIYVFDPISASIKRFSTIKTTSSVQIELFSIEGHLIAVHAINNYWFNDYQLQPTPIYQISFDGSSRIIQHIPTVGATKWEHFEISGFHILAQASYHSLKRYQTNNFGNIGYDASIQGESQVRFYAWLHGHFQMVGNISGSYITDVESYFINGNLHIAVASQMDINKNLQTQLNVYRVYLKTKDSSNIPELNFEIAQKLTTFGARKVTFFNVGREKFLGVINGFFPKFLSNIDSVPGGAVIYKWDGFRFVLLQSFSTHDPLEFSIVRGSDHQVLLVLKSAKTTQTFQFYGGQWKKSIDVSDSSSGSIRSILSFSSGSNSFVLVVKKNNEAEVLDVVFKRTNDLISDQEKNLKTCKKLKSDLERSMTPDLANFSRTSGGGNVFNGRKKITNVIVKGFIRLIDSPMINSAALGIFKEVSRRVSGLKNSIKNIGNRLLNTNFMTKTKDQILNGNLSVAHLTVKTVKTPSADFTSIDGFNFNDLKSKAAYLRPTGSDTLAFFKHIQFENLFLRQNLNAHPNKINLISVKNELANKRQGPNVFKADKVFASGIVSTNKFFTTGKINGMSMNQMIHTDSEEPIIISGNCQFGDIVIRGNLTQKGNSFANGLHWPSIVSNAVRNGSNSIITGHKTFDNLLIQGSIIVPTDNELLMNGKGIGYYTKQIVTERGDYILNNDVRMVRCLIMNLEIASGKINEINLQKDIVSLGDSQWNSQATFKKLIVDGLSVAVVNGIPFDEFVLKEKKLQVISGKKFIGGIILDSDSTFGGKINDFDPRYFDEVLTSDGLLKVDAKSNLKAKTLTISQDFIPLDLQRLLDKSVKIHQDFHFDSTVYLQSQTTLKQGLKTNKGIVEDLVELHGTSVTVHGKKIFDKVSMNDHVTVSELMNSVNLSIITDGAMFLKNSRTIKSIIRFTGMSKMQFGMEIDGKINGMLMDNYLNVRQPNDGISTNLVIQGTCKFAKVSTLNEIQIQKQLNGYDVTDLFNNTVLSLTNDVQKIVGRKTFQSITVQKLDSKWLDGIYLPDLMSKMAFIDRDITIKSNHKFGLRQSISSLRVEGLCDGVELSELFQRVTSDNIQNIKEIWTGRNCGFRYLNSGNSINGYDLESVCQKAISRQHAKFPPNLSIRRLHVKGSISVDGKLSGMHFPRDIITKSDQSKDITISARKYFRSSIRCKANILGLKFLNGVDIHLLNQSIVRNTGNQVITAAVKITRGNVFLNKVMVEEEIIGMPVDKFFGQMLRFDRSSKFPGNLEFDKLVFEADLQAQSFNNLDLRNLISRIFTLHSDQQVSSSYIFERKLSMASMEVDRITMIDKATINGYDMNTLQTTLFTKLKSKIISGYWKFTQPTDVQGHLNVTGRLDGTSIADLFWLSSQYRDVYGKKTFANTVSVKSFDVQGTIGGIDVIDWHNNYIKRNLGDNTLQTVNGNLAFKNGGVILKGDLSVDGKVQNTRLEHMVKKDFSGNINGKKYLKGIKAQDQSVLQIPGAVNGLSWTVTKIFSTILKYPFDKKDKLQLPKPLSGEIVMKDMYSDSGIIDQQLKAARRSQDLISSYGTNLQTTWNSYCRASSIIIDAFKGSYTKPIKYKNLETVRMPNQIKSKPCTLFNGVPIIISMFYLSEITIKMLDVTTGSFRDPKNTFVVKLKSMPKNLECFSQGQQDYIAVVIASRSDITCQENYIQVIKFDQVNAPTVIQTLPYGKCITDIVYMKDHNDDSVLVVGDTVAGETFSHMNSFNFNGEELVKINDIRIDYQILNMKIIANYKTLSILNLDRLGKHHVDLYNWLDNKLQHLLKIDIIVSNFETSNSFGIESVGDHGVVAIVLPQASFVGGTLVSVDVRFIHPSGENSTQVIVMPDINKIWFISYGKENMLVMFNKEHLKFYRYKASGFKLFKQVILHELNEINSFGSQKHGYYLGLITKFQDRTITLYKGEENVEEYEAPLECQQVCSLDHNPLISSDSKK